MAGAAGIIWGVKTVRAIFLGCLDGGKLVVKKSWEIWERGTLFERFQREIERAPTASGLGVLMGNRGVVTTQSELGDWEILNRRVSPEWVKRVSLPANSLLPNFNRTGGSRIAIN